MTEKDRQYDRGIICNLDEDEPFSFVPLEMKMDTGNTFSQDMLPRVKVYKKIGDIRWSTQCLMKIDNDIKRIYYFARIEKGVEQFRAEKAVADLNAEISKWPQEEWSSIYKMNIVDNWFERVSADFIYEKRNLETGNFDFRKWNGMTRRSDKNKEYGAGMLTDDQSASEVSIPAPSQKTMRPRTAQAKAIAAQSLQEAERIIAEKSGKARSSTINRYNQPPTTVEPPMSEPTISAASVDTASTASLESLGSTNPLDKAFSTLDTTFVDASKATIVDIPQDVIVSAVLTEPENTTLSTTFAPTTSQAATVEPDDPHNFTFAGNTTTGDFLPEAQDNNAVILDFGNTDPTTFVTRDQLVNELNTLFNRINEAIARSQQAVIDDNDEKFKKLDKKLDNKFSNVLDIKREVKGMNSKLVGVSEQIAKESPKKSLTLQVQTSTRGRYILLRLIPFNYMGKACDVFFASPFVQEQMCAFLMPYLHKMQFSGINFALAKTTAITFFTPLARAHLIFGKNDNSLKNLMFCKRGLPEGLHNMVDKFLVLAIEEMFHLAPVVHRNHITDMRQTCTVTFSTDRSKFLQLAVDSTDSVAEAAVALADEDFHFYELNKHQLKRTTKVPTFADHVRYLLERGPLTAARTAQCNGSFKKIYDVSKDNIFDEMKKPCVKEEQEIREVIKRICAAAHCFNMNFRNLSFDTLSSVPELPEIYADVVNEIGDNINQVLAEYTAEGAPYQPEVFIGTINTPSKKGTSASGKSKKAVRNLDADLLTDSDNESESRASETTSRKRAASDTSDDDFKPSKRKLSQTTLANIPPAKPGPSKPDTAAVASADLTPSSDEGSKSK